MRTQGFGSIDDEESSRKLKEIMMDSVLKTRHSRRSVLAAAGGATALALAGLPRMGTARAQATPDASLEASITYGYWDASQQEGG